MSAPPKARDLLRCGVLLARTSVQDAIGIDPRRPTPCTEWDLSALVRHLADSARLIRELLNDDSPTAAAPPPGCAAALRELGELVDAVDRSPFATPGDDLIALTGAYELSLHAWDVSQAAGRPAELPAELITGLLVYAPHVVSGISRADLFAEPVPPQETATDLDRLLGLFGRRRPANHDTAGKRRRR